MFIERSSGKEFEVVRSHVDLLDPEPTGAEAFTVAEDVIVPLRPFGQREDATSVRWGEVGGGRG